MHRRIIGIIMTMALCFWSASVMAYDPIPDGWGGCGFMSEEADNVECLGFLTEEEMNDPNFIAALKNDSETHIMTGPVGDISVQYGVPSIMNFRLDNRAFPGDREPDSRVSFVALKGSRMIPQIRVARVNRPDDDCTPDNDLHFNLCDENGQPTIPAPGSIFGDQTYYGPFPLTVYHVDWIQSDEANAICDELGYGSPECMALAEDNNDDGFPDSYVGTAYRDVEGTIEYIPTDQLTITWEQTGETVGIVNTELANYWYAGWDSGRNMIDNTGGPNLDNYVVYYAEGFSSQATGINKYTVRANGVVVDTIEREVFSNRLMPTVAANITQTVGVEKTTKSGKYINNLHEVVAPNMTAREIVDEAGEARLLIQWAEPDLAMAFAGRPVRLRIWVGPGWFEDDRVQADFLWLDVPVTTGSVVVPPNMYQWVKDTCSALGLTTFDVAGMYREQFSGYHNRGYFEGIKFPVQ